MFKRKTAIALILIFLLATADGAVFAAPSSQSGAGVAPKEIVLLQDVAGAQQTAVTGASNPEGAAETGASSGQLEQEDPGQGAEPRLGTEGTEHSIETGAQVTPKGSEDSTATEQRNYAIQTTPQTTTTTQPTTVAPTQPTQPTTVVRKLPSVKRFFVSGWDTTFKNKVNRNAFLPATTIPRSFILKAKRKSIKISWKRPASVASIDGYIILKKTGKSNRYYELKRLPKKKTSYIDKKAKKKNTKYAYMIVAYKKGRLMRISQEATPWVVGYTTASKKKNLYKTRIINARAISTVKTGTVVRAYARVPKKTAHTYLRWTSSNRYIATVDDSGIIRGIAEGTVTISVRTATGRLTSTRVTVVKPPPLPSMLAVMQSWVGFSEKNKKHRQIIDIYNSVLPRPRGYKMRYTDAWCDACISAAAVASGNVEAVGMECGVPSHISIFKKKGIWIEDGTITPRPGDIIVFAWSRSKQPNNAAGSHIGIVESVSKGNITTIEGNYKDMVARRTIKVGYGYIRGFARPNYLN